MTTVYTQNVISLKEDPSKFLVFQMKIVPMGVRCSYEDATRKDTLTEKDVKVYPTNELYPNILLKNKCTATCAIMYPGNEQISKDIIQNMTS